MRSLRFFIYPLERQRRHGRRIKRLISNAIINRNKDKRVVADPSGRSDNRMVGKRRKRAVGLAGPVKPGNQGQIMQVTSYVETGSLSHQLQVRDPSCHFTTECRWAVESRQHTATTPAASAGPWTGVAGSGQDFCSHKSCFSYKWKGCSQQWSSVKARSGHVYR